MRRFFSTVGESMPKLPDPHLHIVYDKDDLAENADFVSALADNAAGRIVVDVTPDGRRLDWLAVDIERALGKNPHLSGAGRLTSDRWLRIHAWLIGAGIKTLFISRVQLLDAQRLKSALDLALACDLEVWLLAQQNPLPPQMSTLLEDWPVDESDMATFRKRWRRAATPKTKADAGSDNRGAFPQVPLDDFPLFRATCRDLLSAGDFETVDGVFQQTAAEVINWIDRVDAPTEESVGELLRELVAPCSTFDEAITRVRAAQVACFWRRYMIKVDVDRVLAAYGIEEQSPLDDATAAKLAQYAAPRYPAAAALALATGASPVKVGELNLGDLSLAANAIALAGHGELTETARRLIAPHVVHRILEGAKAADPLFGQHTTDGSKRSNRAGVRAIERMLNLILREVGVRVTAARSYGGLRGRSKSWRWREGVSIQRLEATAESA